VKYTYWGHLGLALCVALVTCAQRAAAGTPLYNLPVEQVQAKAKKGDAYCQALLSEWYRDGSHGMSNDLKESTRYAKLSAKQQHPMGQYMLAALHVGDSDGQEKSRKLFMKAASGLDKLVSQGDAKAQLLLSGLIESGYAGEKDYSKAAAILRKAATSGYVEAQLMLGDKHYGGSDNPHIKHDGAEALKWYDKAAAQGSGDAYHRLGMMHEHGAAGKKNLTAAIKWYKKALPLESSPRGLLALKLSIRRCEVGLAHPDGGKAALYQDAELMKMMQEMLQLEMMGEADE